MNRSALRAVVVVVLVAAAAAGLVVAVVALTRPPEPTRPIRFAYQNRAGSAACIIAVEEGFFAAEHLRVKAFCFHSGPACAEALYSGAADIGTMGDTTAVITASRAVPFAIIASHAQGEHRHRVMVRADGPLRRPADLLGRTVAVKMGTSTYGGFLAFLAANGLDASRIRVMDMRPGEMPTALQASSIDAFVASEPTPSLAEVRGARQLATLGGLGNSYPILILARRDVLTTRPRDVRRFLRALRRATELIRGRPDHAAGILARATNLPPDVARRVMERHTYSLTLDEEIVSSLARTGRFLKQQGVIQAVPDFTQSVRPAPLEAVLGEARPASGPASGRSASPRRARTLESARGSLFQ